MGIERTVTTRNGVALSVREHGSRDAAHTVVLLHGFCLTKESWTVQIDHLLRRYGTGIRIISYDHRGHGDSAAAPMHTYQVDQLATDLADVLVALQVTSPLTLAGHSMGGMAALAYLGRPVGQRPVPADGLVLVATAAGRLTERGLGRLLAHPGVDVLYELARHLPHAVADHAARALTRPVCGALAGRGGHDDLVDRDARIAACGVNVLATPITTKAGFLHALGRYDQYRTLSAITATTAVISGGADRLTPPMHARDLARQIPGAMHVHLPAAGHMLLDQAPRVISNAIIGVIDARKTRTTRPTARPDRGKQATGGFPAFQRAG